MARRPADPEEELRWMAQEVRGYVEAVLNSLAANVPKVVLILKFYFDVKVIWPHLLMYVDCFIAGSCALPSREGKRRYA